jgi:hypothetical protein
MTKSLVIILVLSCICNYANAQDPSWHRLIGIAEMEDSKSTIELGSFTVDVPVNGNVKQVIATMWEVADKFGDPVKQKKLYEAKISCNKNGSIAGASIDVPGKESVGRLFQYDRKDPEKLVVSNLNDIYNLLSKYVYLLDHSRNSIVKERYSSNGALEGKTIYRYNPNNQIDGWSSYGSDGALITSSDFVYVNNNLTEEILYDTDGAIIKQINHFYSPTNKRIRSIIKFEFRWGTKMIDEETYNQYGQVNSSIRRDPETNEIRNQWSWEYKVDEFSNWTEKLVFEKKQASVLIERRIIYY